MNLSTSSIKSGITELDMTNGELNERYYSLKKQFENLSTLFEATKQELHDTKRSYQTALDVQSHLTMELETQQVEEEKRRVELNNRIAALQEDLLTVRREQTEETEKYINEIKKLETASKLMKEEYDFKLEVHSPVKDSTEIVEAKAATASALSEVATLKESLEEANSEITQWRLKVEELVTEVAEMRAAADVRREEFKLTAEREAAALVELAEAKAMLQQCTDSANLQSHAVKGNSIFAEVEDKRQEMARTLLQMNQVNTQLKRELADKEAEVDALLYEKQTIWEQQSGAAAHFDEELIESYEQRITQLENLCERQRRELARWFGKWCEPTAQGWLSGVMEHLKVECEKLRAEVLACGAAQLASAAQIRELRKQVAQLTVNNAKLSLHSPPNVERSVNSADDGEHSVTPDCDKPESVARVPTQIKSKPKHIDDVKKRVTFN